MTTVHTGDTQKIEQWFRDNPNKETTTVDLGELFDLKRWQVNNAITRLKARDTIVPGERFSIGKAHYTTYRLRKENEARNTFQVARNAAIIPITRPVQSKVQDEYQVLTEIQLDKLNDGATVILEALYGKDQGRIQALNPTTFIAWNSREQLLEMRRNALGI